MIEKTIDTPLSDTESHNSTSPMTYDDDLENWILVADMSPEEKLQIPFLTLVL